MTAGVSDIPEPRLRFPEFVGRRLRVVRLREVTAESAIRNGNKLTAPSVMGVSKVAGIVPMEERLVASDVSRYKIVRKNWFAYNPMRINIGSIARWHGDSDILVSPDYVVFRCLDELGPGALSADYLDHFRQSDQWDSFVSEAGDGGVRVRIYYDDISQLQLSLPDIAEQQRIADCLGSLDDLIAAEGRKLKALRQHKQGLMQQLFPQEGETVPRLRFPEFRDTPEWGQVALEEIAEITLGKMLDRAKHTTGRLLPYLNNASLRWNEVDTSNLPAMYFDEDELDKFSLKAGDVVVCEGGEPGRSAVWDGRLPDLKFQKAIHRVRFNLPFDPRILVFYLGAIAGTVAFERLFTGGGIKHLTRETFARLEVPVLTLAEQQRIADCFSSLDACIFEQSQRLHALRQHKQGLMQQLFPSLEEETA